MTCARLRLATARQASTSKMGDQSSSHNMNGENPALMTCQKVIDEIADDGVGLVAEFGYDAANERAAASMPLEIDGTMKVSRAVDLRPTVRSAGLFRPDFDEAKFPLQLRIAHDLIAQRSAPCRDYLNHCLHRTLRFNS